MKVTQVYGFSTEEIEALSAAGKILGDLSTAYSAQSEDAKRMHDAAAQIIFFVKLIFFIRRLPV